MTILIQERTTDKLTNLSTLRRSINVYSEVTKGKRGANV